MANALNISQFKNRIGDNLPTSHYLVKMVAPTTFGFSEQITLRTETVNVPGASFFSVDNYSPFGNGLTYSIPYRYNPQEITMTHFLDENGEMYANFRAWASQIVDINGDNFYSAHYYDIYVCDIDIDIYNRQKKLTNTVKLIDAYPTVIEPVNLNWGTTDEIAKLNVSYRFLRYISKVY